jgi:hypothetical protein
MAKLSVSKLVDVSKFLQTKAGSELFELFEYLSRFTDQVLNALRKQITFEDNLRCDVVSIAIQSGVLQTVRTTASPRHVIVTRMEEAGYLVDKFGWHIADDGRLKVKVVLDPVDTETHKTTLIILY